MEVTIANHRGTSFGFARLHKDKGGFKRNAKLFRNSTKEAMSIFKAKPVQLTGKPRQEEKKERTFQGCGKEESHAKRDPGEEISIPLTRTCQKCLMISLKKGLFNFQSQKDLKNLGRWPTHCTTSIIGWSVTLLKNASRLKSASCNLSKM